MADDTQGPGRAMTEGYSLLAAVIDRPGDDATRLVYADWLEDHGQQERAEFIRVQVGLDRLGGYGSCGHPAPALTPARQADCPACALAWREGRLWTPGNFFSWFRPLVTAGEAWPADFAFGLREGGWAGIGLLLTYRCLWTMRARRGFVEGVSCPLADWQAYSRHWWGVTPLRVYQPTSAAASPRDEIAARGVSFWQDESVGRLDTLDLTLLLRAGARRDLERFAACARHAWRPWRGLRRVVLPAETASYEPACRKQWEKVLPGTLVEFAPEPADEGNRPRARVPAGRP